MYPIVIIICLGLAIFVCFKKSREKSKYTHGKRVANTKFTKETEYYKEKLRKYRIYTNLIKGLSVFLILVASILVARPVTIQTKSEDKYNRDIIIGLDISTSETEVNLELIEQFKKVIPNIEGDRIGIVIYNTAPIVYCPITDDYEYINECLDKIKKQLGYVDKNGDIALADIEDEEEENEAFVFWYGGVVNNSDVRGSSLVGDGLARHGVCFSSFKRRKG